MFRCAVPGRQLAVRAAAAAFSLALGACASDIASVPAPRTTASITPVTRSPLPPPLSPATTETTAAAVIADVAAPVATASLGSAGRTLKIGVLLPLGGFDQTAAIAKGMKQAAEMALFEAERANVQLIVKDDKGSAEGAKAAAEEAVKEGAEIILGPLFARAVPGAAAIGQAANVPVISFSNDKTVAGRGVYVMGFLPELDVERIVGYAASQNKLRLAALLPDDGYGQLAGAAFRQAVAKAGGTVAALETYPAGANAMLGPSRRIVEAIKASQAAGMPIDAVFMPGGQDVLPQLGPLMAYSGFDSGKVKLLGSGAWEFANIGNNDTFVGGWYPGPDPQGWRAFSGRFVKAFGTPPPRVASLAYDAVNIAVSLGGDAATPRFTTAALTRPAGFPGVDGPIRFQSGGVAERALAILEVQKIGSIVVEPAPGTPGGPPSATGLPAPDAAGGPAAKISATITPPAATAGTVAGPRVN